MFIYHKENYKRATERLKEALNKRKIHSWICKTHRKIRKLIKKKLKFELHQI